MKGANLLTVALIVFLFLMFCSQTPVVKSAMKKRTIRSKIRQRRAMLDRRRSA